MIQPKGDRLLVKPEKEPEITVGGIVLIEPEIQSKVGTIVAVGPGRIGKNGRIPLDVRPGQRIMYSKHSGGEIKVGGEDYQIIAQNSIMGVME